MYMCICICMYIHMYFLHYASNQSKPTGLKVDSDVRKTKKTGNLKISNGCKFLIKLLTVYSYIYIYIYIYSYIYIYICVCVCVCVNTCCNIGYWSFVRRTVCYLKCSALERRYLCWNSCKIF